MKDGFPLNVACHIGRHPRRRQALHLLTDVQPPLAVETFARAVAGAELERPPRAVTDTEQERVHCSLRHVHLPLLVAAEIVEYCAESRRLVGWIDEPPSILPRTAATTLAARIETTDGRDESADTDALDVAYDLLANPTRRTVLWVLSQSATPISIETLATRVETVSENDVTLSESTQHRSEEAVECTTRQLATALHHQHLARLAEAGIVRLADDSTVVETRFDDAIDWGNCIAVSTTGASETWIDQ